MPAVTIVTYVLPVAIVVEVIDARNVIAHIVVAVVLARGIIVVRIVEIRVITAITTVIAARITRPIVVVDHRARLTCINAREHGRRTTLTRNGEVLAFVYPSGTALSYHLGATTVCGRHSVAILVDRDVINPGLLQIHRSTRRCHPEQFGR